MMHHFLFSGLLFCLTACAGQEASGFAISSSRLKTRTLEAAISDVELASRDQPLSLRNEFSLHYVEENAHAIGPSIFASLVLSSETPSLLLEDIDHVLKGVECRQNEIEITLLPHAYDHTCELIDSVFDFLLVTSHDGCNKQGGRLPYKVISSSRSPSVATIKFSVVPVSWKSAYETSLEFGSLTEHSYRPRKQRLNDNIVLEARQATPTIIPGGAATTTTTSIDSSATALTEDFSFSAPPNQQIWPLPGQNSPLSINCTNCSAAGDITLTRGTLSPGGSLVEAISHGFVELSTADLRTNLSFSISTSAQNPLSKTYTVGFSNSTSLYHILDVADISITHGIGLNFGADLAANTDFTFGAAVSVPDNSTLTFSLNSPMPVNATGFDQATFTTSPFSSTISNISLNLYMEAFADIALSADFFDENVLSAQAFVDLPYLDLTVQLVPNGDVNCNPVSGQGQSVQQILGNGFSAIKFTPTVEVMAGVEVDLGDNPNHELAVNKSLNVPSACFAFDKAKGSVVPAGQAVAAASSGAAGRLELPGSMLELRGQLAIIGLGVVAGAALVL